MLRKFKITIDGKEYLVEMEELSTNTSQPTAILPTPQPASTEEVKAPTPQPTASNDADIEALKAPMPGTILKLNVAVGDIVKQNQPLMVLEALKMENEIVADKDGTISAIHVQPGDVVNAGDNLITIS